MSVPKANQSIKDIINERFTLKDIIVKDKIANDRKSLKDIILEMDDEVLANAGVDVFEEVFKLIFTKLYDEFQSQKDKEIINYFVKQVTKTAVGEPILSGYIGGQDYDALQDAVRDVAGDDFRVMEFRNTGQTDTEWKTINLFIVI